MWHPTRHIRWVKRWYYTVPRPDLIGPQKATVKTYDLVLQQRWVKPNTTGPPEHEWRDVPIEDDEEGNETTGRDTEDPTPIGISRGI